MRAMIHMYIHLCAFNIILQEVAANGPGSGIDFHKGGRKEQEKIFKLLFGIVKLPSLFGQW